MFRSRFLLWLSFIGVLLASYAVTFSFVKERAYARELMQARAELKFHQAIAEGYLGEYRGLPALIGGDINRDKRALARYTLMSGATAIVMRRSGSLWQAAKNQGLARALNWQNGKPYYYFAKAVGDEAIIVQLSFDKISTDIENSLYDIILSNHSNRPILGYIGVDSAILGAFFSPSEIDADVRLGGAKPPAQEREGAGGTLMSVPLGAEPLMLHLFVPHDNAIAVARRQALIWTALIGLAIIVAYLLHVQRQNMRRRFEERDQAAQMLESKVAERTVELETTLANLRATQSDLVQAGKMAALGQMSAQLSHEYNQPLAAIRAYTENAVAFLGQGRVDPASENMERVMSLTERMARLSGHLTRFSRRSKSEINRVDVVPVLRETLDLMAGRIERAGAEITLDLPETFVVMGGAVRLQHVFLNLISNAIDATPQERTPKVIISADGSALRFADNGAGIAEEKQSLIFDPFFTTKEAGEGLGLGLSITYNIIEDFGGQIRLIETSENGTIIEIKLKEAT